MIDIPIKKFPTPFNQDFLNKCLLQKDGYNRHGIVHDLEFLDYLRENYKNMKFRDDYRMYNLFQTRRYHTHSDDKCEKYFKDFKEKYGLKDMTHYILEYTEGSFAKVHEDNLSELTLVTLLDIEDGTVGGEVITYGGAWIPKKETRENMVVSQAEWSKMSKTDKAVKLTMMPSVAKLNVNETISYGNRAQHGVTQLRTGRRLVLVQWCYYNFTREEKGVN